MRGKRLNTKLIGNMRTRMTLSCSSRTLRSSCARPERNCSATAPDTLSPSWLSIDCVMTSSPTVFISSSIFSVLTRIELPSPRPCFVGVLLIRSLRRVSRRRFRAASPPSCRLTTFERLQALRATGARPRPRRALVVDLQLAIAFRPVEHLIDDFARGVGVDGQIPRRSSTTPDRDRSSARQIAAHRR